MTETKDRRTGWLKELKAGDRVGVLKTMGGSWSYYDS